MTSQPEHNNASQLPALTGIRFFAIFHIFLHHLWAVYTYLGGTSEETQGLLKSLDDAPEWLMVFLSNGWVSTNLFFMLSGFILAYIYWGEKGQMTMSKKQFWLFRFARIYPIHLIVLALLIAFKLGTYIEEERSLGLIVSSAIGTAMLVHAWIPDFVPMWSWPSWTVSVIAFLYLIMPFLLLFLGRLDRRQHRQLLVAMPIISVFPAIFYWFLYGEDPGWNMQREIFFSNFPVFWIPYFVSGILLARLFSFIKGKPVEQVEQNARSRPVSWGDLAFVSIIAVAFIPALEAKYIYVLRFGILMPLYMILIVDLARGNGLIAKLFSLSGAKALGEIGFSMFIWQAFVLTVLFVSLAHFPGIAEYQLTLAILMIFALAFVSTFFIEKPISKMIRNRFAGRN